MLTPHILLFVVALPSNTAQPLGEIGAYFFETLKESQVWLNLEPQGLEDGPNPLRLNVTVFFPGNKLESAPDTAQLRVESIAGTFPFKIRQPIFGIDRDRGGELDLTGPAYSFQFISACEGCSLDTVIARVSFSVLRDIGASRTVVIRALGFSARIKPADLVVLRNYVDTLSQGVVIR
jgi:hypothetical protein